MELKKVKTNVEKIVIVDSETSEVIDTITTVKHDKIVVADDESFFWTYAAVIGIIDDLTKPEMKVLYFCCIESKYNTNIIVLNKFICERCSEITGLKYQSIKNTIVKLAKKNVLISLGSGTYRINPRYHWKGTSNERTKVMKYILEVECPSCGKP